MVFDHKKVEAEVEKLWAKNKKQIEKSIQNDKKKKLFSFLEGPPTANAPPGLHHLETRVFKDLFCRYKFMNGFSVPRKGGWDCHGLPIEVQVEKKLGLSSKKDVINYGIEKFCATCRNDVFTFIGDWNKFTEKSGFLIDLKNPYITFDNNYIESVWWSLKQLWEKKLLYEGHKVVPYCPRCETALSTHELALGYDTVDTQSFTTKFKLKGESDTYFLVWTTTPWTTPSNVALAINPKITYVFVKRGHETFILAKNRVEHYFKDNFETVKEVKGKDLEGIEYEPLFDYFVNKFKQKMWYVILEDYPTDTDGTGIVHTAPAFGDADYESGKKYNLPLIQPITKDGKFTSEVKDFEDKFVLDADPDIVEHLTEDNKVFSVEKISHEYPFCWRCKTPLIYNAMISWFVAVSKFRKQLVKNNEKINWFPEHIKEGRFGNWIGEAKDWALSRSKFWGTPLPIWRCTKCKHDICIGSIAEMKKLSYNTVEISRISTYRQLKVVNKVKDIDLHKPFVDKVELKCPKCKALMVRIPDVIDCWYDSGSAPFAQLHYPFENKETFKKSFPYDFIAEAIDQTRGWFYTLHVLGTLLFGTNAYKNVVCAGHLVDDKGEKMSKSKGNIINPWEMFDRYGVDATRLLMVAAAPGNTKKVGPKTIEEVSVPFLNILWNSFIFTNLFAEQNKITAQAAKSKEKFRQEDYWLFSRIESTIAEVTKNIEAHEYQNCYASIQKFIVEDLSHWYIKLARDRSDKSAYEVMRAALITSSLLLAPFAPYVSDYIFSKYDKRSVHFASWPKGNKKLLNKNLEQQMKIVRSIVEASNALRLEKGIKLKYPLKSLTILGSPEVAKAAKSLEDILKSMANVKGLTFGRSEKKYSAKPNWSVAGKKFGPKVKELSAALEKQDGTKLKAELEKKKKVTIAGLALTKDDIIFTDVVEAEGKDFEGGKVILDTSVNNELKHEWLARELVRAVQDKRKILKLKSQDRVTLYLAEEKAFKNLAKMIELDTGSKIRFGELGGSEGEFVFEDKKYRFGVKK